MLYVLYSIIAVLVLTNILSIYFLRKKQNKPELTTDANKLLAELLTGGAVVTVQVANPGEIFMYSPKDIYK